MKAKPAARQRPSGQRKSTNWTVAFILPVVAAAIFLLPHLPAIEAWMPIHRTLLEEIGVGLVLLTIAIIVPAVYLRPSQRTKDLVGEWPELAEGLGLNGSKIVDRKRDQHGQTLRLELNRFAGQTATGVVAKIGGLETAARARPGAVRVIPDPRRADFCTLRIIDKDPLAKPVPWPGSTMTSCAQPLTLGVGEDGKPVRLSDWVHVLVGGVTGSGKSGTLNVILGNLATCPDLAIWGIDPKGGMELGPWRSVLDRFAVAPIERLDLLQRANAELDRRALLLASRSLRKWEPTTDEPRLLVVIDELSQLGDEEMQQVLRIAQMGRAAGVQLLLATQHPSAKQLATKDASGTSLRGQMTTRICLRVTEAPEVDMILGGGKRSRGYSADSILKEPGTFLVFSEPEHSMPQPARAFLMADADVAESVKTSRLARLNVEIGSQGESHVQSQFETTDDDRVLTIIDEADGAGVKAETLVSELGWSRPTTFRRLKRMKDGGSIVSDSEGRWRRVS